MWKRIRWGAYCSLTAMLAVSPVAQALSAQGQTSVSGVVTDPVGAPIAGAHVRVEGSTAQATSDPEGRFRISGASAGAATLNVRRLGFVPVALKIPLLAGGNDGISIQLQHLPTILEPVLVSTKRVAFTGRLAGYYERLARKGGGQFVTREQIDREKPRMLSHILHRIPGVTPSRMRGGGTGVRLRGRTCWPLVWLDGIGMSAGEFDLDAIPPSTLQGIELYLGSTTAPLKYTHTRDRSSCGTILLWSRGPDTDPLWRAPQTAGLLERLLTARSIYTADSVDTPARLDAARVVPVQYPAPLYATRTRGIVVAEFVVDATGRPEPDTFGIVSSPHPLFSEAVRNAIGSVAYTPARKGGREVRQLVQQPFSFAP